MAPVCKDRWTPDTFYGKCNRFVTQLGFGCCPQKDISFLNEIASIYSSKTEHISDIKLYDVQQYIEEHHGYTDDFVNVGINDKKGNYILKMIKKYKPSKSNSFKGAIISNVDHFDYFEPSLPIVCILDNTRNISVDLRNNVTFIGRNSSFDFDSIALFFTPPSHENYLKNMKFMTGTSRINLEMTMESNYGQDEALKQMMDFFVQSGRYLGTKYASVSSGYTDFKFSFVNESVNKDVLVNSIYDNNYTVIADGIENVQNIGDNVEYVISTKITIQSDDVIMCHLSVLNSEDVEKEAPLDIIQKPATILDKNIFDVISQENVLIKDHLEESVENIVIYDRDEPYLLSIDSVTGALRSNIVFECLTPNNRLRQDPSNVVSDVDLFVLRSIGMNNGLIKASEMKMAIRTSLRPDSSRVFALSSELRRVVSIISKLVHENPNASLISASHCQPGNEDIVFSINVVNLV